MLKMTDCQIKALGDLKNQIKSIADLGEITHNKYNETRITYRGKDALKNANKVAKAINNLYNPKTYGVTAIVVNLPQDVKEVVYKITIGLIDAQVAVNNEKISKNPSDQELLENDMRLIEETLDGSRYDVFDKDNDNVGYYIIKNGKTQFISKQVGIEELNEYEREKFNNAEKEYLYTSVLDSKTNKPVIDSDAQEKITNQLTGIVLSTVANDLLNKKKANVFYKEGDNNVLIVRKLILKRLLELKDLHKSNTITPEQIQEFKYLTGLFKIEDFLKFQNDIVNRLKSKGYKFQEGDLKLSEDSQEVKDLQELIAEQESDEFELSQDYTGKIDQISDYASFTSSNKEKMSGRLRTFLSSIESKNPSLVTLTLGNKTYDKQYVEEDMVIQAINESLVGVNDYNKAIQILDENSKLFKNREFLDQVKQRLELEKANGSEIVNQFIDKFNQQKNNLIVTSFSKKPVIAYRFKNKEGKTVDVVLKKDKKSLTYYDYRVINANRNDIATNLKDEAIQDFVENNNLEEDGIPLSITNNVYKSYNDFVDYVKVNYKNSKFNNVEEAKQIIKDLFKMIDIELSNELIDELIEGKRNRLDVNFNLDYKDSKSVFHNKYGIFSNIFSNLNEPTTIDKLFGNSGANKLFRLEAEFKDYYYNISTLDGKGRNIWGYSMPSPFFRALNDLLKNEDELYLKSDVDQSLYTSSSNILRELNKLPSEERKLFIENIKYSLFNTLKTGSKEGKELTDTEEQEFIISQLIGLIGSDIKTGKNTYWSNKFLTTPSDKSTMYLIQTPNTNITFKNNVVDLSVDSEVTNTFYNYFLGEYRRATAYQNGTQNYKDKVDEITTYEPMLFYNFPQLNNKSLPLWEKTEDSYRLRDLQEEISSGITVEDFIKLELSKQLSKEITNTRKKLEDTKVIVNGKFINSFSPSYRKKAPNSVSLQKEINSVNLSDYEDKNLYKQDLLDLYEKSDVNLTNYLTAEYAINYLFHNIEMSTLLIGDPAQFLKDERVKFKNNKDLFNSTELAPYIDMIEGIRDNMSKRMAGLQANRMEGNSSNSFTNTIVVADIKTPSKILDEIKKFNPSQVDKYEGIQSMDGGGIMTAEEDLKQKLIHGKISDEQYINLYDKVQRQHEDIEKYGFVTEENRFNSEDKLIAQPIKPVVFGNIYDEELKIYKATYYKDSEYALYPELTQDFTELDKLRKGLYNLSKKGIQVDRIVTKTGTKLGAKNVVYGLFNSDMSINESVFDDITEENIDVIPRDLQGIQLEIPYEPNKKEIRIASQQVKLIFNEISNLNWDGYSGLISKFLPELKGKKVTGKGLKNYHNSLYKELVELSLEDVLNDIGIDISSQDYKFADLEKLQKTLEDTAIELGYSKLSLDGLKLTPDKKQFVLPISFNESSERLEKLLLSLLNKAILQKIHGRSFILEPEMGFVSKLKKEQPTNKDITEKGVVEGETAKKLIKEYKSSMIFTENYNPEIGLLPARRSDPNNKNSEILPAQVLVSWKFKEDIEDFIIEKDGKQILDTSKIDEDLLRILGIRIPTQGHPSMASIEIVGFLPKFMGDMIIAPQDFVAMMGSDFDIDKLYGYTYNYILNEETGKLERLKPFSELSDKTKLSLVKSKKLTKEYLKKLESEEEIYQDILKELEDKKEEQKTAYENLKKIKQDLKENEKELITEDFNSLIENKKYLFEKKTEILAEINAINEYLGSIYEESEEGAKVKGKFREDFKAKEERRKYLFNINKDINEAIKKVDGYLSQIKSIKNPYLEDLISKQEATKNIKNELTEEEVNIILDNLEDFEDKTALRKKIIQNKLQDIYHTIMLHPVVLDKSLEGITEGKLGELAETLKKIQQDKDFDYYSPSSVVNKIEEYFENKAGKMGVGIFSSNSTFLTIIENKGLELQKVVMEKDEETGKTYPVLTSDFLTIKSGDKLYKFKTLSGSAGVNKLISMFQSASVDNAKLKFLNWISVNKDTMGVAALISSLTDTTGVLEEDYIVYFLSQPIIKEYVEALNAQSLFTEFVNTDEELLKIQDKYRNRIIELTNNPINYNENLEASLEELKSYVDGTYSDELEFNVNQYKVLNKFITLKKQADVLRQLQYAVNADAKGVPSSLAEANYKKQRVEDFLVEGSLFIKNIEKIFKNTGDSPITENTELKASDNPLEDNSLYTLQGYLANVANNISVQLFSTANNLVASGSKQVSNLLKNTYLLTGRKTENYSYKFVNKLTKSYLTYLQSSSSFDIQDRDVSRKQEILNLLNSENGLGINIENFKKTTEYKNSTILKPFFESLKIKNSDGFKFVEFKASQGLVNTDEQIIQGLIHLRQTNENLFKQVIKYAFLVKIENSPVSFKKFIPLYYREAIGINKRLRDIQSTLNDITPDGHISDNKIISFEANDVPVYTFIEQFLQHNPEETKTLAFDDFTYLNVNNNPIDEQTENLNIKGEKREKYTNFTEGKEFYLPYVSVYNFQENRYNLFKKVDEDGNYVKISNLGQYNIDEYDFDTDNTISSILPKNKVKETPTQKVIEQPIQNKIQISDKRYTRESVENDKNSMYLFTDNAQRTSKPNATEENVDKNTWYYKKYKSQTDKPIHYGSLSNPTSAVIRGLNNAYPISTMSAYGTNWTDSNFELFKNTIDNEIEQIKKDLPKFKTLQLGNYRIGQGGLKAKLPLQHQNYLDNKLLELGIDNTGNTPKLVEQPINKEIKPNENLTPKDFTNHSGGAYGGDTFWDIIGRTFGFVNNKHYRDAGNTSLSKQLRDKSIKAEVLSKEQMDKARTEVENLIGKKYPDTLQGNLQVRNYYQVANSDGVFAIAKLDTDKGFKSTSVLGGTNTAVQLGIKLNKPVYVWDIFTEKWYKFDINSNQFEPTETPVLTKNFAGVGSRDIENYQVKNKETDKWESRKEYVGKEKEEKAKQAIKDVYQNTLNKIQEQPIVEETKEIPVNQPTREIKVVLDNKEGQANAVFSEYGVDYNQTDEEKVKTILNKISEDSLSNQFKELSKLLTSLNSQFDFLKDISINFVENEDSHYNPNNHSININISQTDKYGKPLPAFSERMQYEILHELVHSILDNRLGKDQAGVILKNRINRLIQHLESDSSLQKAIDLFELKDENNNIATVEYLKNKLAILRQETQDTQGTKYISEAERSILNPLINEREFLVNVLGDNNTRMWMNEIQYDEKSVLDRIWETVKTFFNNLIRTFGFDIKDKSSLQEALNIVFDVINYNEQSSETVKNSLISKLTNIQNPVIPVIKESSKAETISLDYFKQRIASLYKRRNTIRDDKNLAEDVKQDVLKNIDVTIARIKQNIDMLENNFALSEFFRVAQKELMDLRQMLKNKPVLTQDEASQAVQIFNYFDVLYKSIKTEETNFNDPNYKGEQFYVAPELLEKIKAYEAVATSLKTDLFEKSRNAYIAEYNNKTGRADAIDSFVSTENSNNFRTNALNSTKSKNKVVKSIANLVTATIRDTNQAIIDHEQEDLKEFREFEKEFSFNDLIKLVTYKDPNGVNRTVSNYISRYNIEYWLKKAEIFKNANSITPEDGKKAKYIREQLSEISYDIDVRYLFPEEYNNELREYFNDKNIEWVNEDSIKAYEDRLLDFHKQQFSELGDDYALYRTNDVLLQAKRKINKYFIDKQVFIDSVNEQRITEEEKKNRIIDWISYNSPFILLNELIALKKEEGALTNRIQESSPQETTITTKILANGKVITGKQFINWSKRNAKNYIVNKAKNKYENGVNTGFYDKDYAEMEREFLEKENNILNYENNNQLEEANKEKERKIKWEYLQFAQERQQYYLDMMPNFLTSELKWYNLVDVEKDYKEQFDEIIKPVLSLDKSFLDFISTDLLKLAVLGLNFIYDKTVKLRWDKHINEKKDTIDFITREVKLSYNPSGLNNTLNNLGVGQLRTTDVFNYFSHIRNAALSYRERSIMEDLIKLGQHVYSLDIHNKESSNPNLKLEKTELASLSWTINSKIYGAKREETYIGTEHSLFKPTTRKRYNLTKSERDKLDTLLQRKSYLENTLQEVSDLKIIQSIQQELFLTEKQIENIKREITKYTAFNAYATYTSLKFLSFGIAGRFHDFIATGMGSFKNALDGRIYGLESFFKSFGKIIFLYAPNAASSMVTAYGVVSLNPITVATGIGARLATGVGNQLIRKKEIAKINQILYRLGALDYLNHNQDDNVTSFINKQNLSEEALSALKTLNPFSTIMNVEMMNKGIPSLAVLYEIKLKDKQGIERPLIDAYTTDENLDLTWNSEEFEDHPEYDWYKGKEMKKIIAKVYSAQTFAGGDYDTTTAKYGEAKLQVRALLLLRRFISEFLINRFGDYNEEETTGLTTVGMFRATGITALKAVGLSQKNETPEQKQARKAAFKQMTFDASFLIILSFIVKNIIHQLAQSSGDDDTEDLNSLEKLDYILSKNIDRLVGDNLQFINADVFRGRVSSGMISPVVSDFKNLWDIINSVVLIASKKGDTLSHKEMISKGLAPRNKIISEIPQEDGTIKYLYADPITGAIKTRDKKGRKIRFGKYSKNYEPQSRLLYNLQKTVPFINLYLKHQRQENEMIKKGEKVK